MRRDFFMGQRPIKIIHAGALMPRAYLNERATRRSGCILPSGEGLGWGNVSFSSFLCAREKDRYFGSFYKRASFWRNRKKMNKRGCGGHAPAASGRIYKNSGRIYKIFTCRPKKLAGFDVFSYICSQITIN